MLSQSKVATFYQLFPSPDTVSILIMKGTAGPMGISMALEGLLHSYAPTPSIQ